MRSWIQSANAPDCDFPVQNPPYGAFCRMGEEVRCGIAIGDHVLDLALLEERGLIDGGGAPVFKAANINAFMALRPSARAKLRERLTGLFAKGADPAPRDDGALRLVPLKQADLALPIRVAGYAGISGAGRRRRATGSVFGKCMGRVLPAVSERNW